MNHYKMQVRNSLHNKQNQQQLKPPRNLPLFNSKKTVKTQRRNKTKKSRSKTKSHDKSKSFKKVSPFNVKKSNQIIYTSPVSRSKSQKKKRVPLGDISGKRIDRDNEENGHGTWTKMVTEGSPIIIKNKKYEKEGGGKKGKKLLEKRLNENIKTQRSISRKKAKKQVKANIEKKKKTNRLPQIITERPQIKESYFDQFFYHNLEQPNWEMFASQQTSKQKSTFQTHFISNKKTNNYISNSKDCDNTFDMPLTNKRFKTQSYREFGTSTSQLGIQDGMIDKISELQKQESQRMKQIQKNKISLKQIEAFRREQELKWKIISLELTNLKRTIKPCQADAESVLESIMKESKRNIDEVKMKEKQIVEENEKFFNSKQAYITESPKKVREALNKYKNKRNSQQKTQEIIKSISSKKILDEIEFMEDPSIPQQEWIFKQFYSSKADNTSLQSLKKQTVNNSMYNSNQTANKDNSESRSFCLEFEKEMQNYASQQSHASRQVSNKEITFIPEMEYTQAQEIFQYIESLIISQFVVQLLNNEYFLNNFLVYSRQASLNEKVHTGNDYAEKLIRGLLRFLLKSENSQQFQQFINNLNIPYGNSPQLCLKEIRNFNNPNEPYELEIGTTDYQTIQPILSIETISQYDVNTYETESQLQYYFNHSAYTCLNELLDKYRPYGLIGLPQLCRSPPQHFLYNKQSVLKIFAKVEVEFENLLRTRIGRQDFFDQNNQEMCRNEIQAEIRQSLREMDRYLIEEDTRWLGLGKKHQSQPYQELIFQNNLFISHLVEQNIFNEEILMIFNDFL